MAIENYKKFDYAFFDELWEYESKNKSRFTCEKLKNPEDDITLFHKSLNINEDLKRGYIGGERTDSNASSRCQGVYSALSMDSIEDWIEDIQDYVIGTTKVKHLFADWENFEMLVEDDCVRKIASKRDYDPDTRGVIKAAKSVSRNASGKTCPPTVTLESLYPLCKAVGENWFKEFGWVYNNDNMKIDLYKKDDAWFKKV